MSREKDKYRNPPKPPGYVQEKPKLAAKRMDNTETLCINKILEMIYDSKICDEPDVSIYEHFVINPGSDDEEDLVPIEPESEPEPEPEVVHVPEDDDCESERVFKISRRARKRRHTPSPCLSRQSCDEESEKVTRKRRHTPPCLSRQSCDEESEKATRKRQHTPPCLSRQGCDEESEKSTTDIDKGPILLYGEYRCDVCKVNMNNITIYDSHMKGKKHKKAVESALYEAQNATKLAANYSLPRESSSKYPQPTPGYYRKKCDIPSVIQKFLDTEAKYPCPGLHKVIEIRGPRETVYYCSICDCNCSYSSILPHLCGYKHQLNSLKYFRSDLYEKWCYKPKYLIEDRLISILKDEERRNGKGSIAVELEVKEKAVGDINTDWIEKTYKEDLDSSRINSESQDKGSFKSHYLANSVPDPSMPGYYCRVCQCQCNSEIPWKSHIVGKRHLSNLRKNPGGIISY